MFIILNGTKEEHLDMLDGGIIQRLLEEKWKTFARGQFLKRLLILFTHLFCLSISIYLRPARPVNDDDEKPQSTNDVTTMSTPVNATWQEKVTDLEATDMIRYGAEVCTILGVLSYIIIQQGDEVKNQGFNAFLKQTKQTPAKAIFIISNIMILACIPLRVMGNDDLEEAVLLFAVPGSWFFLMFFAG